MSRREAESQNNLVSLEDCCRRRPVSALLFLLARTVPSTMVSVCETKARVYRYRYALYRKVSTRETQLD